MVVHRIETRPGLRSLIGGVRGANVTVLSRCQRVVAERAIKVLAGSGYGEIEDIGDPLTKSGALKELRSLAEEADDRYLTASDQLEEGAADDEVMRQFAVARALAALVFIVDRGGAEAVLQGAYELCVVSPEEEAELLRDLADVLKATSN